MEILAKVITVILTLLGVMIVAAGLGLLLAFPIKWTWNATMPFIWGLPMITWGKAWCLSFLTSTLIKSTNTNSNSK